jgi:hypothetical protein
MNKIKILLASMMFSSCQAAYALGYFELHGGLITSNASQAPAYGVRLGLAGPERDFSFGYWTGRGMSSDRLVSGGLNLEVLDVEYYRTLYSNANLSAKLGGGVGFAIPNLDGGASETADNGHCWIAGGAVDFPVTEGFSYGFSLKGFFFTTDTHVTVYGSHTETLSTGQDVEVLDVSHYNDRVNFNSAVLALNLRWK